VPPEFSLTVRDLPGAYVVALSGELDIVSAEKVANALVVKTAATVVVDLADLAFIDSTGIGALIRGRNQIMAQGNQLVVTRPQDGVLRVLDVTGLGFLIAPWCLEWDSPVTQGSSHE
jgi:anti-sigma B factor antagonist